MATIIAKASTPNSGIWKAICCKFVELKNFVGCSADKMMKTTAKTITKVRLFEYVIEGFLPENMFLSFNYRNPFSSQCFPVSIDTGTDNNNEAYHNRVPVRWNLHED